MSTKSPEERVEDLRRQLHEAELAAAVNSAAPVIRNVTQVSSTKPKSTLGSTILSKVEVNGISTEALIDTGSPVTIISLDFATIVMAKERNKFKNVEEWQEATLKKFEPPEVTLKNYGGGLDVLAQLPVRITQGDYGTDVKVLVRKDAPNRLLLGTDAQPLLGYVLIKKENNASGVDLATGKTVHLDYRESGDTSESPQIEEPTPIESQTKEPTGGEETRSPELIRGTTGPVTACPHWTWSGPPPECYSDSLWLQEDGSSESGRKPSGAAVTIHPSTTGRWSDDG